MDERMKVLLIDDSEIVARATQLVLEKEGFDVKVAQSVGEFNVILKTWSPNVVLTDVEMPGFTGVDLCRWIKVRLETQSVPVVLYSVLDRTELAELAKQAGADGYISKSEGLKTLAQEIRTLCQEIVW